MTAWWNMICHIGKFLDKLDELGIADNTIVFYSTDNGPHMNTWPDAAMTPFRGEKNTNWEGGWRVPPWCAGPGRSRPVSGPTKSCITWTGCQPFWPLPVSRM